MIKLNRTPKACLKSGLGMMLALAFTTSLDLANAHANERVVIATTGGTYEKALRDAWFIPFTKETGIEVVTVSATDAEKRAKVTAMVQTNNVTWDLYLDGEIQAGSDAHYMITEDLSEYCRQFDDDTHLVADACTRGGARLQSTATLLAYKPGGNGSDPKKWGDMWNVEKFPGGRAFPNFDDPWRVLAAALLADGVAKEELFPIDVDRAFRKLDEIRPAVQLWWKTGDQSVQGFRNDEYRLGQIWLTRAKALQAEGFDIGWSYDGAFLVGDRIALIRGAQNRENALKLITYWLKNPSVQSKACETLSCTPPSQQAISMMSQKARDSLPSPSDVEQRIIVPDAQWINANMSMLVQRWNEWIR
ncbi:ABC transporter substrate-binding protein (plasmid) [Agrobacterium rosae]|uniref:ABC transporter substrate-binding protein n=2 Tax=Agrobacterium rosae TaxID=1972867 RepID=A0AAE5RTT7_9HYPH|nr:ABC transporter substrate-binding protein [Agrobacterium rosae]KAA3513804.1 ABC transporter substrate-binding protein [Agrobacterium rosae]MCM2435724.1 ABC transporter substrate-binding protein [Agrobacterium rosae]MQB50812.1 ABC transporter substrate-binding protein [Agrobacterium rosae]POO48963.1 ABC transporter substrate-binding protein [Agrobacterium rosae]